MIEYENNSVEIIQYRLISDENKKLYDISCNNCYEKCEFKVNKLFKAEDNIGNLQEYLLMIKGQ